MIDIGSMMGVWVIVIYILTGSLTVFPLLLFGLYSKNFNRSWIIFYAIYFSILVASGFIYRGILW